MFITKRPYMNLPLKGDTNDIGTGGNTITPVGSPTYTTDQFGRANSALNLNGSSQYLDTNFKTSDLSGDYSIIVSINYDTTTFNGGAIASEVNATNNSYGAYFVIYNDTNNIQIAGHFANANPASTAALISYNPVASGSYKQFAFVRKNNSYHRIYYDGALVGSNAGSNVASASTNNLRIGNSYTSRYLDGSIEYWRLYQGTISSGQIKLINSQKGRLRA